MKYFVVLIAMVIGVVMLLGCHSLGNNKVDPFGVELVDLSAVDINVEWVSDDGRTFKITRLANGQLDVQAEFTEPSTGLVFVLGEGVGALTIRSPQTGLQISIQPEPIALKDGV